MAERKPENTPAGTVTVRGTIKAQCTTPNGLKCIKESFASAKKSEKAKDATIEFFVKEAPKYRIEVSAKNQKVAEELLQEVGKTVVTNVTQLGGKGSFRREK